MRWTDYVMIAVFTTIFIYAAKAVFSAVNIPVVSGVVSAV